MTGVQTCALPICYGSAPVADVVAVRAIRALREIGVLRLVHKGIKGHSSLYAVMPLPPLQSD